jgi:hypothetical protein
MAIVQIDWLNRSMIKVFYDHSTYENYDGHPFLTFSKIRSCIPVLSKNKCNMIQIIAIKVALTKIVISYFGQGKQK